MYWSLAMNFWCIQLYWMDTFTFSLLNSKYFLSFEELEFRSRNMAYYMGLDTSFQIWISKALNQNIDHNAKQELLRNYLLYKRSWRWTFLQDEFKETNYHCIFWQIDNIFNHLIIFFLSISFFLFWAFMRPQLCNKLYIL